MKISNNVRLLEEESDVTISNGFHEYLDEKTAALAMVASYQPAKITPTKRLWAEIGLEEELNIEDATSKLEERHISNLILVINSFGGAVSSSFKISYALRKNFDNITVLIPHIAASGGTLIALSGDELVMGDMSELTPIDIQIERNGIPCSVNAMIRSFR